MASTDQGESEVVVEAVKDTTVEEHRMGVIGALAKRMISQMYFRNILAMLMVGTLCWKEIQGFPMSEHFYMLAALVVGMYFPSGENQKR
jgi:hypothetical protein